MERELFRTAEETRRLVAFFLDMSLEQAVTFAQASAHLGFPVTSQLPAYHSARRIAMRDHGVIIEGVRGAGFKRLNGQGMLGRGNRLLRGIRRRNRRGAAEMEVALRQNLDSREQLRASELFNRFRLGADIATSPISNRKVVEQPPTITGIATPALLSP